MIFKIDVDGVLRNMETPMVDLYNEKFGQNLTVDDIHNFKIPISFPLYEENGIDPYCFLFDEHSDETLRFAPIYEGAREAMQAIASNPNNKIIIVTHQPTSKQKKLTLDWIEDNEIPYDVICFTDEPDKTSIKCDVLVDDCNKHLDAESDVVRVCINHVYNQEGCYEIRLNSFKEITSHLQEIEQFVRYKDADE